MNILDSDAVRMGSGEGREEPAHARSVVRRGVDDPDHSEDEKRFLTTGRSDRQRVVIVWHTDRNDRVRLIGARGATPAERHAYQDESG